MQLREHEGRGAVEDRKLPDGPSEPNGSEPNGSGVKSGSGA